MSLDAKQSLIAFGSVLLFVTLFSPSLYLFRGVEFPDWVDKWMWPVLGVLFVLDLGLSFVRWRRSRRAAQSGGEKERPAELGGKTH